MESCQDLIKQEWAFSEREISITNTVIGKGTHIFVYNSRAISNVCIITMLRRVW